MKEQLIQLETAKLAKEKGFNEETEFAFRIWYDEIIEWYGNQKWNEWVPEINEIFYSRPTQSLLQKWLRDVHGWHIFIDPFFEDNSVLLGYNMCVCKTQKHLIKFQLELLTTPLRVDYKTYEEALEQGLLEALKLVK